MQEVILLKVNNKLLHKRSFYAIQFLTVVLLFTHCTINIAEAQTAEEIAEKALAATVYLEMKDKNGTTLGFGSGFFVQPNLIATNYHVIEGATSGTAKLVGKYTKYNIEGVTATDKVNDLVLLKVSAYGIKPLPLGDSDAVKIGATVYVAGNPIGLEGTFSDGIISSRRDKYTKERLQMTAPISPGSSGGPILNRKGEVIGITHMTIDGEQNLNFAIPSKYLNLLLAKSTHGIPLSKRNQFISAETYYIWGCVKHMLKNHSGAISDYGKAIQLKPDYAKAYHNRGYTKVVLKKHLSAITDFDEAIRLNPDYDSAYVNRGLAKKNAFGNPSIAIPDYNKAIQINPKNAAAFYNRGAARVDLGQPLIAIPDYDKAIQIKPNYAKAYSNRGYAKFILGQHTAAIVDYNKALKLKPDLAEAYSNRGVTKAALGQHLAAITDFDKAIRFKPDFADAYSNRGITKVLLGRASEGKQDLKTALKLAEKSNNQQLKSAIEQILQGLQ